MEETGRQIHCVIGAGGREKEAPPGGNGAYAVPYKDLRAIVSRAAPLDSAPLPRPELLRHLGAHQSLLEEVMVHSALFPVKFGTWVRDDGEVVAFLRSGYSQLRRALAKVAELIEMDVVALWRDLAAVFREIGEEEEIRGFRERIGGRPPEESQEERIELGKRVKASLDARRLRCRDEILSALGPYPVDRTVHEAEEDSVIVNAAFLLPRAERGAFERAVESVSSRLGGAVRFRCVGPLPPCSFCALEVKRVGEKEAEAARGLLGLPPGAGLPQAKAAHRALARLLHPDRLGRSGEAQERFRAIEEAYRLLRDYFQGARAAPPGAGGGGAIVVKVLEPA